MDWGSLAEKLVPPALTAVIGFLSAALGYRQRITHLELGLSTFKVESKEELSNLKKAWRLELDDLTVELNTKIKELAEELKELDAGFTRFQRASNTDFADATEMRHFIEEQQKQWQQIQRTLGQIEGLMEHASLTQPLVPRPKR